MARKDVTDAMVVQAACWRSMGGPRVVVSLMAHTGQCEKVVIRALERSYARGLIECGTSITTPWLTEAGEELLRAARLEHRAQATAMGFEIGPIFGSTFTPIPGNPLKEND
jgi:hypothetical protein